MQSCLEEKKGLFPALTNGPAFIQQADSSPNTAFSSKMKRLCVIVAVAFCFAVGQALNCYKCDIGFWNLCLTTKTTCAATEQCFSGEGKAANFVRIKMKGCLSPALCNATTNENVTVGSSSATVYKITKTCCVTDLCNAAPALPAAPALSLTFATTAALFVANMF